MRIGVLGTGTVGRTLATALLGHGHAVTIGSRVAAHPDAVAWAREHGPDADAGTFADAARGADLIVNATAGVGSLAALGSIDPDDLDGTVVLDVANPLDFSAGFPPRLSVANDDSLGEALQRAHPQARIVKSLNTVRVDVMIDAIPGTNLFLSGDDPAAKDEVVDLLAAFGWQREQFIDLGDITTARGPEMYLALWVRLYGALGTADFNIGIVEA